MIEALPAGGYRVTLDQHEMFFARLVGAMRQCTAAANGQKNIMQGTTDWRADLQAEVLGVMGEFAFAKLMCQYWQPSVWKQDKDMPDVAPHWDVRTRPTDCFSPPDLLLRPSDNPNHRHVLVWGDGPVFEVRGWILGSEGFKCKQKEARPGFGGTFHCVPQEKLSTDFGERAKRLTVTVAQEVPL